MLSVTYDHTGPSAVLELVEKPIPAPGVGEVRVRVVVSGVNPTDWKARQGSGDGAALPTPQVPNQDGAGAVDAVGEGVTELAVGQRVWIWDAAWQRSEGTAQDYVVLPVAQVVPLPEAASYDSGASLGIPALTAHRALTCWEGGPDQLAPGTLDGVIVLVTGGAGAVSHAAIQLARWAGATVITTVSSDEKAALAGAAGAEHIVNYRSEDVVARVKEIAPRGVDVVVEVNAAANLDLDVDLLAPSGTIAIYTGESADDLPIPVRPSMTKNIRYQFILTYTTTKAQKRAAVRSVSAALADGALGVGEETGLPITRFSLAETAAAHDAVEGGAIGKVLIDVAG